MIRELIRYLYLWGDPLNTVTRVVRLCGMHSFTSTILGLGPFGFYPYRRAGEGRGCI